MSKCHIIQVRNNLMESIIPNALMKWNSAFATDEQSEVMTEVLIPGLMWTE